MELLSKVTRPTSTCDPARRRTYSGRKLPGFTVASDAPLLLSLTSVAHIYDELNTQSVLQWSQAGELGVFRFTGCFSRLEVSLCIRPRQLCRRRLQLTAELRCTSRGYADPAIRMKHSSLFSLSVALGVCVWESDSNKYVYLLDPRRLETPNCGQIWTNTGNFPSVDLCVGLTAV